MYGTFGMEPQFDSYGINSFLMWYDAEDGMMSCWMNGETHSFIYLNDDGDCVCHEADYGPNAIYPQPLGPSVPYIHGPRSVEDICDTYGACYGFNEYPSCSTYEQSEEFIHSLPL